MKRGIEEQLELFDETGAKPPQPESGAPDEKSELKKAFKKPLKKIFNPEDMRKIFGEEEAGSESGHGHPRHRPVSEAEKKLGWVGRYYGNDGSDKSG